MDREYYQELFLGIVEQETDLQSNQLEFEIEIYENEDEVSAFMRFLTEQGVMYSVGEYYHFDLEKAEQIDPRLKKILEAFILAESHYQVDQLIQDGLLVLTVDDKGEFSYEYTEEGKKFFGCDQD